MDKYKYHVLYKTLNIVNGNFYYGIHSTDNLDDRYIGSGYLLKRAIQKYGHRNFKKEILIICATRQEINEYEKLIVSSDIVANFKCYNLKTGGQSDILYSKYVRNKISNTLKTKHKNGTWVPGFKGKTHTLENRLKISAHMTGRYSGDKNPMYGKTHTDEVKKFLSENNKGKKTGDRMPAETRARIGLMNRNTIFSPETRKRQSVAKQGVYDGSKNPNAKIVYDVVTNEMYGCMKQTANVLGISLWKLKQKIRNNEFLVRDKKNV